MTDCRACGGRIEAGFRFCPWCATPLRRKLVEFFAAVEAEHGQALRVSRYVDEGHVRFSVWDERGRAQAALSIPEGEADRLASFLGVTAVRPDDAPTLVGI